MQSDIGWLQRREDRLKVQKRNNRNVIKVYLTKLICFLSENIRQLLNFNQIILKVTIFLRETLVIMNLQQNIFGIYINYANFNQFKEIKESEIREILKKLKNLVKS